MDLLSPSSGQKMKAAGSSKTFYEAFSITDYTGSNGRTIDELKGTWKEAVVV